MACRLSGNALICKEFFKRAGDIILHFWRQRTLKHFSSYIYEVDAFCGNQQIDCVSSTLCQALDFLVELFKNGIGCGGINTSRPSLSCIINPLALILQSQGILKGFFEPKPTAP